MSVAFVYPPQQQSPAAGSGLLDRVLTYRGVAAIWIIYAAANALIRYAFSRTLSNDDSISSTLAHGFKLGYQKIQPPLWEWLLVSAQRVLGTGIESFLLLRYVLIALIGIGIYRASLIVSGDRRWAAAISFGVPLAYQLGWP